MRDKGREETDEKLKQLEKEIASVYQQANRELMQKMNDYFKQFKKKDEEKRKQLENGDITADEYKEWRINQMMTGQRWKSMCDVAARDMYNSNRIARNVVQGHMPEIYAINHNWTTYNIENKTSLNTNFALYNAETVENLLKDDPDILPLLRDKDGNLIQEKDTAWNRKVINSVMLQGILQGESIDKMAKRFEQVGVSNNKSAVRYARTAITGAENAGRMDGYRRAEKLGIKVKKVWLATLDDRTRDSHRELDGEEREVEEKFSNDCLHPGDPNCSDASEVWNCRCTLITKVNGDNYDVSQVERDSKLGDMSYEEWKQGRKEVEPDEEPEGTPVTDETEEKNVVDYTQQTDELITQIRRDALINNTADHNKAIELGRLVMESPNLPYSQYSEQITEKTEIHANLKSELDKIKSEYDELENADVLNKTKLRIKAYALQNKLDKAEQDVIKLKRRANASLIESIYIAREGEKGGELAFEAPANSSDARAKKAIEFASKLYPREWVEDLKSYIHLPITAISAKRGQYIGSRIEVSGTGDNIKRSALHELAHGMEEAVKGLREQEKAFYEYRTKGEELRKLKEFDYRYDDEEMARFDDFENPYMGKDYGGNNYELVSDGFPRIFGYDDPFVSDVEMERWLVGLLCAL